MVLEANDAHQRVDPRIFLVVGTAKPGDISKNDFPSSDPTMTFQDIPEETETDKKAGTLKKDGVFIKKTGF